MALALFNRGDAIMIPAPSYASFDFDLKVREIPTNHAP